MFVHELPRRAHADDPALERTLAAGRPAIVTGLADAWPARAWTLDMLARRGDACEVTMTRTVDDHLLLGARGLVQEPVRLGAFIRERLPPGGPGGYVMAPWEELPAALASDVPVPPRIARAPLLRRKLWVSRAGTVSPLHRDMPHNVLVQLIGRKRVWLAAPGEARNVYPFSLLSGSPNLAHADLAAPDLDRWPRSAQVSAHVGDLEPGDGVYIPSRWWHQVRTDADSVSVNFWWGEGLSRVVAGAAELVKRVRGLSR